MPIDILPFQDDMILDAAALLAQRHQRDRAVLPELPPRFSDPDTARAAVETTWRRARASGVAAVQGGRLLGYLIGDTVIEPTWGRSGWVRPAGCALAPDQDAELVRDLYAALGARWVDYGCFAHFTVIPIADPALVHAWFALSFGVEQVHGLLDLESLDRDAPDIPAGIAIRRAGPADRATLADLSDIIWRHQTQAPVWGIHLPKSEAETREGWAELVDDPTVVVWLAFVGDQAVGSQGYWPIEAAADALLIPEGCARMSVAGTRESARGRGIATALTRHGLAQARASGYRYCETDWRSTNLLAARFWPRQGFRPLAYRLVRRIDPRIAWANGQVGAGV